MNRIPDGVMRVLKPVIKPVIKPAVLTALLLVLMQPVMSLHAEPPRLAEVRPGRALVFPRDHGAHPDFRTEWWYATGWLQTPEGKPLGFQVTFFRSATAHDAANTSRFAPRQLIVAHAALSDPALGKLQHDQKIARAGFGIAQASEQDTDVKLQQWTMQRQTSGQYRVSIPARDFTLSLTLTPTQPALLQGEKGYSRKGPQAGQASYYYSQPHLQVEGEVTRMGKRVTVSGTAWLDHEWSTTVLDARAVGWDWLGANLDDGGALMAFRIRTSDGGTLWQHASLRDARGQIRKFAQNAIRFTPLRHWRSPRTGANYPVQLTIDTGDTQWQLTPLQDDQELDSRLSTGAVYWEGAVTIQRNQQPAGRGYLEMTGYVKPLKL